MCASPGLHEAILIVLGSAVFTHAVVSMTVVLMLVMQIKGPNVPKDALAGGGDLPDTAGLDTLGKVADAAGEKVSGLTLDHLTLAYVGVRVCVCTSCHYIASPTQKLAASHETRPCYCALHKSKAVSASQEHQFCGVK